jgi:GNAT superfamily N-acetyltransferase
MENIKIEPLKKDLIELKKFAEFFYKTISSVSSFAVGETAFYNVNLILNIYLGIIPTTMYKKIFVAKANKDEFIGYAIASGEKNRNYDILEYLYISPEYRNKGIGTALVKEILTNNNKDLVLYVEPEKNHLLDFYSRLGFKNKGFEERIVAIDSFGNPVMTKKYYKLVYKR